MSRFETVDPQIVRAVYQSYNKKEEIEIFNIINKDLQDLYAGCEKRKEEVKHIIAALSKEVSTVETNSKYPYPEGTFETQVSNLQAQLKDAQTNIQKFTQDKRVIKEEQERLQTLFLERSDTQQKLQEREASEEPNLRHQLSLYAHITKVFWTDEDGQVAGTISNPQVGDIKSFSLDPLKHSKFELVNALWDMI
uniref:Kinetochore protein Spc24 n=1 Tax=Polytomella parva TaxID=51329 RepID=A0A7S0V9M4_9CHLO|mmetsp:Transcript_33669/g.60793  ORF Transcript_33669/g.60793 Transcript_33669/m.60793 type:complete len:194 (+) Transcript_33669:29-610(+)